MTILLNIIDVMLFHSDIYKVIRNVKPVQCSCRLLPAPPAKDANSSSDSTKPSASGIATVSESKLMSQVERVCEVVCS
jgi:hypothetical protein